MKREMRLADEQKQQQERRSAGIAEAVMCREQGLQLQRWAAEEVAREAGADGKLMQRQHEVAEQMRQATHMELGRMWSRQHEVEEQRIADRVVKLQVAEQAAGYPAGTRTCYAGSVPGQVPVKSVADMTDEERFTEAVRRGDDWEAAEEKLCAALAARFVAEGAEVAEEEASVAPQAVSEADCGEGMRSMRAAVETWFEAEKAEAATEEARVAAQAVSEVERSEELRGMRVAEEARIRRPFVPKACEECGVRSAVIDGWCGLCTAMTQSERDHELVRRQEGLSAELTVLGQCVECGLRPRLMEGLCDGCLGRIV